MKHVFTSFLDDPAVQAAYSADVLAFVRSVSNGLEVVANAGPTEALRFDAWVPAKSVGVDVYDLMGGRPEVYRRGTLRDKMVDCRALNARAIQFLSDEWLDKGDITRSVIANAVGSTAVKLNGRDCTVEIVSAAVTKPFLTEAHIQGAARASHHVVLRHPDHGIVGCVTVRTPIQKKHGHVCELARLAFKPGTSVRGGAGKLIDRAKEHAVSAGFEGVLSYADLRFGTGNVYPACGFQQVGETTVNYFYVDPQGHRWDRFKYRAQPGKSERQVVEEAGVRPVWGAGHRIFLWKPGK